MAILAASAVAALVAAMLWLRQPPLPQGLIQANGRIEGDHYAVAGKIAGKISQLLAREGERATQGQVLIRLDDAQTRARVEQARQAVTAMTAQLQAGQHALELLRKEVPLTIQTAEATVALARSQLGTARVGEEQAKRDASRFSRLMERGTVAGQRNEQMDLAWQVAKNQTIAAQKEVERAERQRDQSLLGWERIKVKADEVAALAAQLKQAQAALAEALSLEDDLTIRAPAAGVITQRLVDVGEVVAAGAPLLDIVDLDRLYLKVYVPEKDIGKVRLGLPARIHTDAYPDQPLSATVRYIASQAEFTPKEVQTPDERVKLVYAVKLYLDANPEHRATPGLPADAVIRWEANSPWASPRW
ncbi:MAG: HlyD family efflux transporter periplasmic adaptor subunit [Pseudomonadota bacterium]